MPKRTEPRHLQLRGQVNKRIIKDLESTWLSTDTSLSFQDWLYLYHNIFSYHVDFEIQGYVEQYLARRLSDPFNPAYQHFVRWLLLAHSKTFIDHISGRSSKEIITLYETVWPNNTPSYGELPKEYPPTDEQTKEQEEVISDRFVVDTWDSNQHLPLLQDYKQYDGPLDRSEWLLAYHNVALPSMGASYVDEYNESVYSILGSDAHMTFPKWLAMVKKVERIEGLSFLDIDMIYRQVFYEGQKETPPDDLRPLPRPIKKGPTLTIEQLDNIIDAIKTELAEKKLQSLAIRLKIAEEYRTKLLDKLKEVVYTTDSVEA